MHLEALGSSMIPVLLSTGESMHYPSILMLISVTIQHIGTIFLIATGSRYLAPFAKRTDVEHTNP